MRPIHSLNVKHPVTQEELINGISDTYGFSGDKSNRQSSALLRLAIDDVVRIMILISTDACGIVNSKLLYILFFFSSVKGYSSLN